MTELTQLELFATTPHACSYLDDKEATTAFINPNTKISVEVYSELSDYGFRRSGGHIYRPHCADCSACISVRIPVDKFKASRSQKRCLKRNSDLEVIPTQKPDIQEHYALYEEYISQRHADGDMYPPSLEQYREFLNNPLGCTHYLEMREQGKLVGCAVSDRLTGGLSAIYTYFAPDAVSRGLGKFAILHQIERAQSLSLPFVYLGYWIKNCDKMAYKTDYRPIQLLINQQWITAN